jgi:membrane protease YdiL (CAAX protease family)
VSEAADPLEGNGSVIARAVVVGIVVLLAGTLPRNAAFAANLRFGASLPWSAPLMAAYVWFFWRYAGGWGPPEATAEERRASLRAGRVPAPVWAWSLLTGLIGIVTLVLALRFANRLVVLPEQTLPDLRGAPRSTVLTLLLASAPIAGIVGEAAFRGYMQGPIERRIGLPLAILITGTMFAVAHLDFTPVLWPYYVAVAALYGAITHRAGSILPAIVLHTAGNVFSNLDLWLHGRAEWQAPAGSAARIGSTGFDRSIVLLGLAVLIGAAATAGAYAGLARVARKPAA